MATACVSNDEFWKECTDWLIRWGILRPDHQANLPDANIGDLANTLRDGVILCKLLNKIDPQCIDMKLVNLKPAFARFLCLRNIGLFLNACKNSFLISDHDLFEDTMLFDLYNFHKVLCTLSKLSLSHKVSKTIVGFHAKNSKSREEEEIYQCLQSKISEIRSPNVNVLGPSWLQFQIRCPQMGDRDEEVYDDLCYVTFTRLSDEQSIDEPCEKRDHVIKELIDTERNYVEVLTKLYKNFYLKLRNTMTPDVLETIFYKIRELCETHEMFLDQLGKLGSVKLSHIFINMRESFLVYGEYCANLSNAYAVLQDQCEKHPEIGVKVEELEKQVNNGRFKLRDVLSVPMQRVLKYHLLLEKLVEYTDPKHEEYKDLKSARECMIDVNGYINEYSRDTELKSVIRQIRENITNWDAPIGLEQCGKLVKDGELKIKPHDDGKIRTRYVFIFQKYVILCKAQKDGKFTYRDIMSLNEMEIQECNNRAILNQNARWGYQWILFKNIYSTAYTCSVRTIQLKEQMVKALRECIDNLKLPEFANKTHKFEMYTFDKPTLCWVCAKYLKGLLFQGYFCKECGSAVHRDCIRTVGKCGTPPPLTAARPALTPTVPNINDPNEKLKEKLWFVGEMDRQTASARLQARANGTFLVRLRSESDDNVKYALSLKTDNTVKHMKICATVDNVCPKYFLSSAKYFNSLEELIGNYQLHSLKESFERLQESTKLEYAFKNMRAVALRDYEARDEKQMSLRAGQEVIVYRQEGYRDGWWMGSSHTNGRTKNGFFPVDCVQILELLHAQ
ncbi:protein vav isoform X1 [Onthophagus taurus]|uniref:protein vav isoform X1 n=1 Tax=Onthophagus taurus TaxID=166361 RepID=UPI0039BDE8F1